MSIDLNQISVREIFASNDIDVIRDLCGDEAGADIIGVGIVRKIKGLGGLLTAWAFVLACVGEIWKIEWGVGGNFCVGAFVAGWSGVRQRRFSKESTT